MVKRSVKSALSLASPAVLIVIVWSVLLLAVAVGPLDYHGQPSVPVLVLTACGTILFIIAHLIGVRSSEAWFDRQVDFEASSRRVLNWVVGAASVTGIVGIALIALDRVILSGANNADYTQLLRCAPTLVDIVEIKRTPLLYLGYLTFSFSYAALVLFLLRGEQVRGWMAALAQLSFVSPIGYALLYSGRMPILFFIVLIAAAILVRWCQGLPPLPPGHHLLTKTIAVVLLFAAYSSAMWSIRQGFCVEMGGLIRELQAKLQEQEAEQERIFHARIAARERGSADGQRKSQISSDAGPTDPVSMPPAQLPAPENQAETETTISAENVSRMIKQARQTAQAEARAHAQADPGTHSKAPPPTPLLSVMIEAWEAPPRDYIMSALNSGLVPQGTVMSALSSYFYLTHGVRVFDVTWRARNEFSPHWGVYEIGVLSPILRVFFPDNELLATLSVELKSAGIYGFSRLFGLPPSSTSVSPVRSSIF
ncbi:hypothetical protein ACU4GH_02555 [Bradyrhizobium betae]